MSSRAVRFGVVMGGGAFGSLVRYAVALATPTPQQWPLGTLTVNLAGALALGWLTGWLDQRATVGGGGQGGAAVGVAPARVATPGVARGALAPGSALELLRLGVGVGVLGGFTTYSTFGLELFRLLAVGSAAVALGYAAATLLIGTCAALGGYWLGSRTRGASKPLTASRSDGVLDD